MHPHHPPATHSPSFHELGLHSNILKVLDRLKFHTPTPIQHKTIPIALEGKDVMGIAQTGTGKTLAFSLPMIERLIRFKGKGLIILPTRELALQVNDTLQKVGGSFGLRTAILIGGANINTQIAQLKKNPHILVGTPGRIIDHLQQKTLPIGEARILVLDEADQMLDMGFAPQIKKIIQQVPRDRQTLLFSATMPDNIVKMAVDYMKFPLRVEVAPPGTTAEKVSQEVFIIEKSHKDSLLAQILNEKTGTALIFSRTKYGAKNICRKLRNNGHAAAEIHSNRSLNQRKEALDGFKSGKYRVLVATDIAARGIDVRGIGLVINYDIPEFAEDYVHRIGRTGRAGMEGHAITFATPDQHKKIRGIERLIKTALKISKTPFLPKAKQPTASSSPTPQLHSRSAHQQRPHGQRRRHAHRKGARN